MPGFDGLGMHLGNLPSLSTARTRSISPENPTGEPGGGGRAVAGTGAAIAERSGLGPGWKLSPSVHVAPGDTHLVADIEGAGAIQQIWLTPAGVPCRALILRIYWDGADFPSVEVPLGDFFACGWGQYAQVSSLAVCVNPGLAFNAYWPMPFRKGARITIENTDPDRQATLYYQVNYAETDAEEGSGYFHAHFRRSNPVPYGEVHTLIDGIEGTGHFAGTYMAWGVNNAGWWGEGEIKFYLDEDEAYPTICGTGTEDYFCGAYNFDPGVLDPAEEHRYVPYTTPYAGLPQVIRPDGVYRSQQRFGMYRWHIMDPIRFASRLKVTIQALGWRGNREVRRYLPLQDDLASTVFYYLDRPTPMPAKLPHHDQLEVV